MPEHFIFLFFIILLCMIAVLTAVVIINTLRFKPPQVENSSIYKASGDTIVAQKLAKAVRVKTVSHLEAADTDWESFRSFHKTLEEQFPLLHSCCERTIINGFSLVYHWKTPAKEVTGKPILITAHMDVVPVEEGTQADWTKEPFGGSVEDGFVWGRGTLDTKIHLIAAMEAMERLIKEKYVPARDIYLAFGHDEEINGEQGALKIAEYFKQEGLEFEFVLDEGGCVASNVIAGLEKPVALIGVGEKGFANIKLTVERDGGHASMPSKHTSLGFLAQALCRLEQKPCRPRLIKPVRQFLLQIGPYMKGINHVILANLWLFKPIFMLVFPNSATGSALLRTTIAVTMAQGSPAPNVVPQKSGAMINCRILPSETGEDLMNHIRKAVKGLPVELEPVALDDPSRLSSVNTNSYHLIEDLTRKYCGDAIVAPYLVMASTDARKYEPVCENIFRFSPYLIDSTDIDRIHGTNERISIENVNRCVDFFEELMRRC